MITKALKKTFTESKYLYCLSEDRKETSLKLSEQVLWSCQSLEFGRKLGLALKELHNIPVHSKSLVKNKIIPNPSFSERLKHCENLWRKHENQFEEVGLPIAVLREIFMGYEDLEVENEEVLLHGNLSCQQVMLSENFEFIGLSDWGESYVGNRGLDISLAWMIFEEPVAKAFFTSYGPIEESQFELSLFQSLYYPMVMLPHCFKIQDENLKQWTAFALRKAIGL
ncbi:MAG: phosphotransferase [Bdellovibrionota bacterium]